MRCVTTDRACNMVYEAIATSTILSQTAQRLRRLHAGSTVRVESIHLTRHYTIVHLNDGSAAICMSYARLVEDEAQRVRQMLAPAYDLGLSEGLQFIESQLCTCVDERLRLCLLSVFVTSMSGASAALIAAGGDAEFRASGTSPFNAAGATTAVVVGWGGYLKRLLKEPTVRRVHIVDYVYAPSGGPLCDDLAALRASYPAKHITASTDLRGGEVPTSFDLACITGSTLCNGTLDTVLDTLRGSGTVILQGQSASIHPGALFEAGVHWCATTLKTNVPRDLGARDYSGAAVRHLMESRLPNVYLTPAVAT